MCYTCWFECSAVTRVSDREWLPGTLSRGWDRGLGTDQQRPHWPGEHVPGPPALHPQRPLAAAPQCEPRRLYAHLVLLPPVLDQQHHGRHGLQPLTGQPVKTRQRLDIWVSVHAMPTTGPRGRGMCLPKIHVGGMCGYNVLENNIRNTNTRYMRICFPIWEVH